MNCNAGRTVRLVPASAEKLTLVGTSGAAAGIDTRGRATGAGGRELGTRRSGSNGGGSLKAGCRFKYDGTYAGFGGTKARLLWRPLGSRGKRRIFCFDPTQKHASFFGRWGDNVDACRRPRWRRGRRIDDLEEVKAECVQRGGSGDEAGERKLAAPWRVPVEDGRKFRDGR